MNFKTTLMLLVLVAIGGAIWLFSPADSGESTQRGTESATPATRFVFDPQPVQNDIVRVSVARAEKPTLVFERSPRPENPDLMDDWRLVEPIAAGAESHLVTSIVSTTASLRSRGDFVPGEKGQISLADAGLEKPVGVVTLADKTGKEYKLEVGRPVPMSNDTYVRVAGAAKVQLAGRDLSGDLKRELKDYRSKSLVKLPVNDVVNVQVTYEGKTYELSGGRSGDWVLNQPIKAYADNNKVRSLINQINALRAVEFIADKPPTLAAYGLDEPYLSIQVTSRTTPPGPSDPAASQPAASQPEPKLATFTLQIGTFSDMQNQNRAMKLADQDWVASIPAASVDSLIPRLSELRDPRLARIASKDITKLELVAGGESTVLQKVDGRWTGEGDLAALEMPAITDLLEAIEDTRVMQTVDQPQEPSGYGLEPPRATLRVWTSTAVEPLTINVGRNTASGQSTFAQVENQPGVLVLNAAQAARLAVTPLSLRARDLVSAQPERVTRVEVARDGRMLEAARQGGEWALVQPEGAPIDPAAIREITNDLARLRAKRIVARGDEREFGLQDPQAVIRFSIQAEPPAASQPASQPADGPAAGDGGEIAGADAGQAEQHVLMLARIESGVFGRLDEQPYIFELDETVYQVLTSELINRQLFKFEASQIVGLKIEAPGGTLDFALEGNDWTFAPDPFLKLHQTTIKPFIQELAALRVEQYLNYAGVSLADAGLENAPVTVTVRLADGAEEVLKIDQVQRGELPRRALWVSPGRLFLLRAGDANKLMRGLDYYCKPPPQEQRQPGEDEPMPPEMPGQEP